MQQICEVRIILNMQLEFICAYHVPMYSVLVWFPDPSLYNRMREGEGRVWANSRPWRGPWNFISVQETQ